MQNNKWDRGIFLKSSNIVFILLTFFIIFTTIPH